MGVPESAERSVTIEGADFKSPVGLIAGNGTLPLEFTQFARSQGLDVVVIAHKGETDPRIEQMATHCTWIKVGALGTILKEFKRRGVAQVACAGGIKRVNLFGGVSLDFRAMAMVAKLRSVKDDALLRGFAAELTAEGLTVFSPHLFLKDSVPVAGTVTKRRLTAAEISDAKIGWEAAAGIGALDIGQTVVVSQGVVVAVEAVEGTDRCIERACALAGAGCVVVKRAKPQQDLRLDLPTIGPGTIDTMSRGKAAALVIEAGRSLILDRKVVAERAEAAGICILGASKLEEIE